MNRVEALEKISKALSSLMLQTRAENLAGFLSKNRLVEDLLLPVFQIVLNAPRLRNLNQENVNFPYIDLADDRSRLAIQVTTERSAAKVTETLHQFTSHNYHKRFKRLVFFILTASKPSFSVKSKRKWKKICGRELFFDPQRDIIATEDLFALIAHLTHSKVLSIHDLIAKSVIGEAFTATALWNHAHSIGRAWEVPMSSHAPCSAGPARSLEFPWPPVCGVASAV